MPIALPPPGIVSSHARGPVGAGSEPLHFLQDAKPPQDPQPPLRIPQTDLAVEVVGQLPLRTKLEDVSRLLGQRQQAGSSNRTYPPTILELIMLVERNPARPPGRQWNSISVLTIGYDAGTKEVIVEYCLDHCTPDHATGAPHSRQRMASYRAPEQVVVKRLNKKLGDLKKYSAPRFE